MGGGGGGGIAGGVADADPHGTALDHGWIGVAGPGERRRNLLDAVARLAVVQVLGVGVDPARQHDLGLGELERVQRLVEDAADGCN